MDELLLRTGDTLVLRTGTNLQLRDPNAAAGESGVGGLVAFLSSPSIAYTATKDD